jgi:hypothetical protein
MNLVRDEKTGALLNNDAISLNKYKLERDRIRKIDQLSKEVKEIKKVLSSVCERLDKIESI